MAREIKGQIMKMTEKYIYTCEIINTPITEYFIKLRRGQVCTVYTSREAAEADGPYMAKLFNDPYVGVIAKPTVRTEFKDHRYKRQ